MATLSMNTLGSTVATTATTLATQSTAISAITGIMNSNKYILGIMIILINIGARYIGSELTDFQHKVLNHKFVRRLLIFLVIWMGTRDIIVAIILTATFIILVNGLFNENSKFCIIPKSNTTTNNISRDDYDIAKRVIEKYEKDHPPNSLPQLPSFNSPLPIPSPKQNITQNPIANNKNDIQPLQSKKQFELFDPRLYY
jgi:hypothetical protein